MMMNITKNKFDLLRIMLITSMPHMVYASETISEQATGQRTILPAKLMQRVEPLNIKRPENLRGYDLITMIEEEELPKFKKLLGNEPGNEHAWKVFAVDLKRKYPMKSYRTFRDTIHDYAPGPQLEQLKSAFRSLERGVGEAEACITLDELKSGNSEVKRTLTMPVLEIQPVNHKRKKISEAHVDISQMDKLFSYLSSASAPHSTALHSSKMESDQLRAGAISRNSEGNEVLQLRQAELSKKRKEHWENLVNEISIFQEIFGGKFISIDAWKLLAIKIVQKNPRTSYRMFRNILHTVDTQQQYIGLKTAFRALERGKDEALMKSILANLKEINANTMKEFFKPDFNLRSVNCMQHAVTPIALNINLEAQPGYNAPLRNTSSALLPSIHSLLNVTHSPSFNDLTLPPLVNIQDDLSEELVYSFALQREDQTEPKSKRQKLDSARTLSQDGTI